MFSSHNRNYDDRLLNPESFEEVGRFADARDVNVAVTGCGLRLTKRVLHDGRELSKEVIIPWVSLGLNRVPLASIKADIQSLDDSVKRALRATPAF